MIDTDILKCDLNIIWPMTGLEFLNTTLMYAQNYRGAYWPSPFNLTILILYHSIQPCHQLWLWSVCIKILKCISASRQKLYWGVKYNAQIFYSFLQSVIEPHMRNCTYFERWLSKVQSSKNASFHQGNWQEQKTFICSFRYGGDFQWIELSNLFHKHFSSSS